MTAPTMAALLAALERLVDERVEAKLRDLGVASAVYASSSLPPNVNARTFARWCRNGRVVGAERDGSGWRCSASAWREARAAGPSRTAAKASEPTIDAMIAAAGLRSTREGR